jgi:hypothetical protein
MVRFERCCVRREFRGELSIIDNIDKRAVIQGKEAIRKEVESKFPLKDSGGYIP